MHTDARLNSLRNLMRPLQCRSFVYFIAVICLTIGSSGLASSFMCEALFSESIRFLDVNEDNTQFYVDGVAVGLVRNSGRENIYIFRSEEEQKIFIYKLAALNPAKAAEVLNGIQLGALY